MLFNGNFWNQLMTEVVLCHWLTLVQDRMVELILSNSTLLILPIWVLAGFNKRHWVANKIWLVIL